MAITVAFTEDPARVLRQAGSFLTSEPVLHNLILSLLHARVVHSEAGRYWMAMDGEAIVGVAFQSPLSFAATITPMNLEAVASIVDAISNAGVLLPGVHGDAATAARFAGQWTERNKIAAVPYQGQRLYELIEPAEDEVGGHLRRTTPDDRALTIGWLVDFQTEIGERVGGDPTEVIDRRPFYVWDDGEPCTMGAHTEPIEGVVRVQYVFTPPEKRSRGYATACIGALSRQLRAAGYRPILFTDLGNPTSNSIYRRIGYRAVAEALRYRFG